MLSRRAGWLVPLAALAVGMLIPLWHIDLFRDAPGNIGDARFNTVILEHFYRWVTGGDSSLMSPPFYYPLPGVLTFSDNHWGTAWIYAIFRALGCSRYVAFDWWYLLGFVVNFVAAHVVLRRLGSSIAASSLGAFVFAFSLPAAQLATGHAQFSYRLFAPIALLCLHRFWQGRSPLWLAWCALAVTAQLYIAIYTGFFTVLALAAWTVGLLVVRRRAVPEFVASVRRGWVEHKPHFWMAAGLLALAGALTVLLMYPYVHYPDLYGFTRDRRAVVPFLPRPGGYLLADQSTLWSGLSSKISVGDARRGEQELFVGLAVLTMALVGLVLGKGVVKKAAALTVAILVLLTIYVGGHSLYLPLGDLPGFGAIRAVARIVVVLVLPLGVLVAIGLDALRARGQRWAAAGFLLAGLVMAEALTMHGFRFDIAQENRRVEAIADQLPGGLHRGDVLFVPVTSAGMGAIITELDAMVVAQDHGASTLNGYSGSVPRGYGWAPDRSACDQAQLRIAAARALEPRFGVRLSRDAFSRLRVLGAPTCVARTSHRLPRVAVARVGVAIVSQRRLAPHTWQITVRVTNGSHFTVDGPGTAHPLDVSWRVRPATSPAVPGAWTAHADLTADIAPGGSQDVTFTADTGGLRHAAIDVGLVLEGRTWLDGRRSPMVSVPLRPGGTR